MKLTLYNTLTGHDETFTPLDPAGRRVTFYSCGPTVYDYAHIGNFRSFLNADLLRRTLELLGYEVVHVMNMTDVGHMTDDEVADGAGEDKMEAAGRRLTEAKKSGKLPADAADIDPGDPFAIADFYVAAFLSDAKRLGLKIVDEAEQRPELMPRPTRYIEPMIELITRLIDRGHAYVAADGVVYFAVRSFPAYGDLSGNTPDKIRSGEGGRVNEQTQQLKKHPADFMLWKPDRTHVMKWPSPWGEGYPGWHLECSVMAMDLLGSDTNGMIDIHSGGEDNIFPHHECELAQTCSATGEAYFARYWFHTRFLIVESAKMSKSKGNFYTLHDLLQKGASPAAVRLELTRTHYRSNANFTMQGLRDSQRQIDRWDRLHQWLDQYADSPIDSTPLGDGLVRFTAALAADLNVAGAIGVLNEAAGAYRTDEAPAAAGGSASTLADERGALRTMLGTLGVLDLDHTTDAGSTTDGAMIETRLEQRKAARQAGDFATADRIRDELLEMGIAIKDDAQGTTWSRVVQ